MPPRLDSIRTYSGPSGQAKVAATTSTLLRMAMGQQEFLFPADEATATIVAWLVAIGDRVIIDRPICTVESTDGPTTLTSPYVGTVTMLGPDVGTPVEPGELLVTVVDDAALSESAADPDEDAAEPTDESGDEQDDLGEADNQADPGDAEGRRTQFSPLVRRLADEHGIDPATLEGTGPGGRVTRGDVQRAAFPDGDSPDADRPNAEPPDADIPEAPDSDEPEPAPDVPEPEPDEPEADAPEPAGAQPFSVFVEVQAEQLLRARDRLAGSEGGTPEFHALLIRLVLPALDEFPVMSSSDHHNIAFNCTTERGEVDAVVADAARGTLQDLDRTVADLTARAAADQLEPHEMSGQTFGIIDVGPAGADTATVAPEPGTAAVVVYGRRRDVVTLVDESPRTVPMMTLAGTFDNRATDLGEATRFLHRVRSFLEDPILAFAD